MTGTVDEGWWIGECKGDLQYYWMLYWLSFIVGQMLSRFRAYESCCFWPPLDLAEQGARAATRAGLACYGVPLRTYLQIETLLYSGVARLPINMF